jgi:hypothetical protein
MGYKKTLSHRGETPQDGARKKVSHGDTAQKGGCDTYPCLLVDLDSLGVENRGQQHTRNNTSFPHPVSAYLNRPAAFTISMTRSE